MSYPIITPYYFAELSDRTDPANDGLEYKIISSPSAIEYVFPSHQERLVRKLMATPDVLQYKMTNLKPENEAEYAKAGEELIKETPILTHYWNIKSLTMNILQNRNYIFEKRMLLLNYTYKTIQGMIEKSREDVIAPFIADFTKTAEHGEVMKYFEAIKPNFAYSLCDGLSFLRAMPKTEAMDKVRYTVFKNVGVDQSMRDFKFDENKYLPMKKAYYEDFLKDKEYYIEQIMVNLSWEYCMPFADHRLSLWDNFVFFNTIFNALKVMLTCYTFKSEDKDEAFVAAVTAFSDSLRKIPDNIVRRIVDANNKEGLATNGDMAILAMS